MKTSIERKSDRNISFLNYDHLLQKQQKNMAAAIATLLHKDFRTRMWFSEHVTENKQPNEKLKAKSVDMTSCLLTLQPPSFFAKKASEDNLKKRLQKKLSENKSKSVSKNTVS